MELLVSVSQEAQHGWSQSLLGFPWFLKSAFLFSGVGESV